LDFYHSRKAFCLPSYSSLSLLEERKCLIMNFTNNILLGYTT
jgi:hypothetical protein